jgi:DNA primase
MVEQLESELDMSSLDGRARMAELAKPLLSRIPEGIYRDLLVRRIADRVGMDPGRLSGFLGSTEGDKPSFRPASRGAARPPSARSSLIRQAITLVIHHPVAAATVDIPEGLSKVDIKGAELLLELLELCADNPALTTAGLLERYRERPEHPHLLTVAASELLVSESIAPTVIGDTLQQIVEREAPGRRTDVLLAKARDGGLDEQEKEELRELLARRAAASEGSPTSR